jgi:oligosaccharyltransferase complex subunit beta
MSLRCVLLVVLLAPCIFGHASPLPKSVLVLLDSLALRQSHSLFFDGLQQRGYDLTFKRADDQDLQLAKYGEYLYDALIMFAPTTQEFGGKMDAQEVLDFIDAGHPVLISGDSEVSDVVRDIATGCGIDFAEDGAVVVDHFHYDVAHDDGTHTTIVASEAAALVPLVGTLGAPVLFRGIGHTIDDSSELAVPILTAHDTSYSHAPLKAVTDYPHSTGKTTVLVSALQARNNARVVFSGSLGLFSNEFFGASIQDANGKAQSTANQKFAAELSRWLFNEKGFLRFDDVRHHPVGQQEPADTYRIKDYIQYHISISEWKDGKWVPFTGNDVQLEFVRLDPHIRTTLKHDGKGHYTASFQIPDVYGVFTFKVDYKRLGYSYLESITRVPVRPYKHNEYERFIESAYPYYAGTFSMVGSFLVFAVLFLYSKY